jgi:hypothetical protein
LQTPRLALATLASWLDSIGLLNLDNQDFDYDGDDLPAALLACRDCFLDVYTRGLVALTEGVPPADLERQICQGVSQHLVVGIEDIEQFKWGVPCEGLGIDLEGYDGLPLDEAYPRLRPVLDSLGFTSTSGEVEYTHAGQIATHLVQSLDSYTEAAPHQDFANLLRWIFGASGNTLVDNSNEMLYESGLEPLDWTPDNVAFMNEVQTEAQQILDSAFRALERLEHDAEWQIAFQANCQQLMERTCTRASLAWPAVAGGSPSDAADTST